jgi:hypothetical protein
MSATLNDNRIDSIGHSRILASINQFTERTVSFLNRSCTIADLKLVKVSERILDASTGLKRAAATRRSGGVRAAFEAAGLRICPVFRAEVDRRPDASADSEDARRGT